MSTLIIDGTSFNPSEDVAYNKPRVNKAGGKAVGIVNKASQRQLMLNTPLMLTWGVQKRVDENSGRVSFSMSLQFPKEEYSTPETRAFLENIEAFEEEIRSSAIKNSKLWFNKAKLTEGQVDVLFNNMLYWPKDKETGERREGAAPTLRVKLDYWDEQFSCELYDLQQKPLFPNAADVTVTPEDLITKGIHVACVLKCGGVYFVNGKFGVTWKLEQAILKPKPSIRGKCAVRLTDSDRKKLEAETHDDEVEDSGDVSVTVEDDSDEDESDDDSSSIAEQAKVEVQKEKKKVVKKKRVVRRKKTSSSSD